MQQLLEHLASQFVGEHFIPVVRSLYRSEQTLSELFESCSLPYEELTEQLKYLVKQDIVAISKSGEALAYSLSKETLLYFQRTGKYSQYITELFNKDEQSIVQYLIQNRTSSVDQVIKAVSAKKSCKPFCYVRGGQASQTVRRSSQKRRHIRRRKGCRSPSLREERRAATEGRGRT